MEMPYMLEVLWCRTFQSVLKIGNYFMGYRMPKYLEGPGKIKELGAFLKEKGINDVLDRPIWWPVKFLSLEALPKYFLIPNWDP